VTLAGPPSLVALAWAFTKIGLQSFGSGMSPWIRREVVQRHGWMEEQAFLSGLALGQLVPGPNGVNLAAFVGTTLRGGPGALAAIAGMMLPPMAVVLVLGAIFASLRDVAVVDTVMAGVGAGAIGLNVATGARMCQRGLGGAGGAVVAAGTALAIGWFGLPLPAVLLAALPVSWVLTRRA
jgi:chromate transporter